MVEREGVIKFSLDYQESPLAPLDIGDLTIWYQKLKSLGLLGQDPRRYDGYGFGNLSMRTGPRSFLITGTQTGHLDQLKLSDYALVIDWDIARNRLTATGETKPSSESLSHAAVYDCMGEARFVFHVHSPELWNARQCLKLPATSAEVPYGTPQMAEEIVAVLQQSGKTIVAMAGHEDGVLSFGKTADEAGEVIAGALRNLPSPGEREA